MRGTRVVLCVLVALLCLGLAALRPKDAFAKGKTGRSARATSSNAAPDVQKVQFKTLAHDIVVRRSACTGKRLRRKLKGLYRAIRSIEERGYRIGVCLQDLDDNAQLTYAGDETFYPASSIKGPYVICLYESLESGALSADANEVARLASPTIAYSDNDSYRALRLLCGGQVFADWAVEGKVTEQDSDLYQLLTSHYYPMLTSRQLARMWKHAAAYLLSESDGACQLLELFAQRDESPLRDGIPSAERTIAKAGWYPADDGAEFSAAVDAGIVEVGGHRYVIALMTNAPGDLQLLTDVVDDIFSCRRVL